MKTIYYLFNNNVYEVTDYKISKKGNVIGTFTDNKGVTRKNKQMSATKVFLSKEEAEEVLQENINTKERQKARYKKEEQNKHELVEKIYNEFNIKIPMLSWSFMDYDELTEIYYKLKENNKKKERFIMEFNKEKIEEMLENIEEADVELFHEDEDINDLVSCADVEYDRWLEFIEQNDDMNYYKDELKHMSKYINTDYYLVRCIDYYLLPSMCYVVFDKDYKFIDVIYM